MVILSSIYEQFYFRKFEAIVEGLLLLPPRPPSISLEVSVRLIAVVSINSNELILEAFKGMKDNQIGGFPVVEGQKKKIVGN